ncbi:MAG: CxxC-x17-CxxC domain-containing protein [Candidatus Heimdallarchaeota archaeon]
MSNYGNYDRPPREMHKVTCADEMHKVTCADCGQETEVPFKPDGTRPVYCQDCYKKRKPRRY